MFTPKQLLVYVVLFILGLGLVILGLINNSKNRATLLRSTEESFTTIATTFILPVPYTNEMPEGIEKRPWVNACEEASIVMIDKFYQGETTISTSTAVGTMKVLFAIQDKLYGSNDNSSAEHTAYLINNYESYRAVIKENPTLEEIKNELRNNHPVLSFHYGFDLKNKNIPFASTGSSYHAMVIVGYDDDKQGFLTHDPGDTIEGAGHLYDYQLFMNSLHDYDEKTKKADGPARVLFTSPRE
ncbi:MAG: C39 family peptidase [Candidatus Paceibacterota bacterium]|jgi:uncharacterized protein YvpB